MIPDQDRTGAILGLAREITMATRMPGRRSETDDALGIDHGYDFTGHNDFDVFDNGLECDLIEAALVELDLAPDEQALLIWAVVDYQHQPLDELRALALPWWPQEES